MTKLPPDVRDRAAKVARVIFLRSGISESSPEFWPVVVDAVAAVVLGEDVIVLSKADAAWLCGVIHGEAQTEQECNRAHQLLAGGA